MLKNKTITINDMTKMLALEMLCGQETGAAEITGGYCSDLLSDVMANGKKGDVWITYQIHTNIVAVAVLKEMAGIVITGGRKPDDGTLKKARAEKIPILSTSSSSFEIAGKLYELGISGSR